MGQCWRLGLVNMSHFLLLHCIVLHLYIGITISQSVIRGTVGQAITLPCTYSVQSRDHLTHMCWGKDKCPNSKCSNEILRTNGMQVISRTSRRYQLNGQITRGDVSLTILNANKGDHGAYCCRIEVRGWFNDIKKTLILQVDTATTTASTTTITTTPRRIVTTSTTTPLTTTVVLATTTPFLSTIESTSPAVPVIVTKNTNVPTRGTSSLSTAIALVTASPFNNIKSLTTGFQYETTDNGPWFLVTETLPPTTVSTTGSIATTTTSHRITTINSNAFLASTVTPPISPPFLLTDAISPIISTVVPTTTNASAMTTSFVSMATALLTTAPSLVNTKPLPMSLQEERAKNDYLHNTEITSSVTGSANAQIKDHNLIPYYVIASSVPLLMLLALVIVVKCKKRQKYHLSKNNLLDGQKELEQMLAGAEGENGLFIL